MLKKLFGFGKKTTGEKGNSSLDLGVDTEMGYCPVCGDEYRAGISRCAGCDVPLISGREKYKQVLGSERERASRTMDILPNDERVTIRTGKLKDLKPVQVLLARETIPTLLTGESAGCGSG
jgi:hypothetical protein